ncbi:unnamed protein product [Rotaria magnacalcarata]
MDEKNLDSFNKLLFDNALGNIESSPHTDKKNVDGVLRKEINIIVQNASHQNSFGINENLMFFFVLKTETALIKCEIKSFFFFFYAFLYMVCKVYNKMI